MFVIYCYGDLVSGEMIMMVVMVVCYCKVVFEVVDFLMDYLKFCVLFWKCEIILDGVEWVVVKDDDEEVFKCW